VDDLIDFLAPLGASLAQGVLGCVTFGLAIWAGIQVGKRKGEWAGWLAGIAVMLALAAMLAGSFEALDDVRCNRNPEACAGDNGPEEWP